VLARAFGRDELINIGLDNPANVSDDRIIQDNRANTFTQEVAKVVAVIPLFRLFLLSSILLLTACQSTVYMMPTPELLRTGERDPFAANPGKALSPDVQVAYVTNRLPAFNSGRWPYVTLFDQKLRLGLATVRVGGETYTTDELYTSSTAAERESAVPLTLVATSEQATLAAGQGSPLTTEGRAFFDQINASLESSRDPDITVYLHGANNSFYRSTAQAAQYAHFTGRNSTVLLFSWPSAESLLRYAVDVNNARRTFPLFAELLELLAEHTNARYIDVLAYSAGAQVLSPALASLRARHASEDEHSLRERFRLGEIYYAAPDVDFKTFLRDLETYDGMVQHVTLALNPKDSVLAFAARHHGVSRAGRPEPGELTEEETRLVKKAFRDMAFDLLWIEPETIPGLARGAHDFWYNHPWVSSDVLIQLLYQARPSERGLTPIEDIEGRRVWTFGPDYPQRANEAIEQMTAQSSE
jgi:esterase/lipase superfamily enzyme